MTHLTPEQRTELERQLARVKGWSSSMERMPRTNFDKSLHLETVRLLETLLNGRPSTPLPTTHHA
jgi:hypothetical protein